MKNIQSLIIMVLAVASLAACSKWNQDPMAGQDQQIKNGLPNPGGEAPKPGTSSDNIRIDTVKFYRFQEQTQGNFKISARVLMDGYTVAIVIDNLADFPGATFTEADGFTWTPGFGTTAGTDSLVKDLIVHVVAHKGGVPDEVRTQTVPLVVVRLNKAPTIVSVNQKDSIREGESQILTVVVRDESSTADEGTWPSLLPTVSDSSSYGNLAAFMGIRNVDRDVITGNLSFQVELNLNGQELTRDSSLYAANLIAHSSTGMASAPERVTMTVLTSFSEVMTSWFDTLNFTIGQPQTFKFLIFNNKDNVKLSNVVFRNAPLDAMLSCSYAGTGKQACSFQWTPLPGSARVGSFTINAEVTESNTSYGDPGSEVKRLRLQVSVQDAPAPTPTPSPTPVFSIEGEKR
jgi:hypothetical protein